MHYAKALNYIILYGIIGNYGSVVYYQSESITEFNATINYEIPHQNLSLKNIILGEGV